MIFLKRNFDWVGFLLEFKPWPFWLSWEKFYLGLFSTWALKKEKNNLNQIKVVNLVKLEDFPLATLIKIAMILLIVSSVMYCYNLPSWNF